ncbi:MAG: molybdopterin-binding protein [Bacillota bacterium]|nr:molybdopterin-binding protein [Bacillota bacterium]
MIKKIKTEEAIGQPLLHDITGILENGFKGVVFKRNHIIKEEDIEALKDLGKDHVYVGDLEADQVHEEDAILELKDLLCGPNVTSSGVAEGKITLKAEADGLFTLNSPGLFQINSLGDYTLATIKNFSQVKKGDKLCGARIVPLWTSRDQVEQAKSLAKEIYPLFQVHPYHKLKVGIIITGDEVYYGRIKDRFEPVLRDKLAAFDSEIIDVRKCPDDLEKIQEALDFYLENQADLVIFTGGMSVDPDDLTPRAIKNSGATMIIQGLPVQPGNMLTIGDLDGTILIGVPGASIHSPVTSFDFALPRIFAKIELKKEDFIAMGEGGLL